LHYEALNVRQW